MPEIQKRHEPRPHVLIATNALTGGGAQRANLQIAHGLAQNGFPTSVLTVRSHEPHDVVELDPSTTLYDVCEARWPRWVRAPHVLRHVLRVIRDEEIDLVISGSFGLNQILLAARAVRILRCPVIVVEHLGIKARLDVLSRSNPFAAKIFRRALTLLYPYAEKVVAVSHGVAKEFERLLGLPSKAITTIYNGIDVEAIRSKINERPEIRFANVFEVMPRPIVISVGRLEPQKAYDDLLRAFALLPNALRGSLIILGDGSQREMLTDLSSSLGLGVSVHLPGHVANPWWFVARSNVFALSSKFEGLPLVLIEALACGVPMVSTDCPWGPREVLEGVENARLAPVSAPMQFSAALSAALRGRRLSTHAERTFEPKHDATNRFSQAARAEKFACCVSKIFTHVTQ